MLLLKREQKEMVFATIELYMRDPYHTNLGNHPLREWDKRVRSVLVEDDLRIILRDSGDGSILLLDVWDHARVYGK
jgi:mRNA-degrading endonuclease YafQ of YafQ-DinJ toxin-antitoxin module